MKGGAHPFILPKFEKRYPFTPGLTERAFQSAHIGGAPVAQWVKRWPTDLADRVRSSLEVKSSQP